jgi:Domain of unknown function (DUF5122) beta-propeller
MLIHTLGIVVRARGMMKVSKETGITRAGLYPALSPKGNPSFEQSLYCIFVQNPSPGRTVFRYARQQDITSPTRWAAIVCIQDAVPFDRRRAPDAAMIAAGGRKKIQGRCGMKRTTSACLCVGFLALNACGGGGGSGPPPPPPLAITPASIDLLVNGTETFAASGGTPPYEFSVVSGGGSIDATSGKFTAPGAAASVVVQLADSGRRTANGTVHVLATLVIAPANASVGASTVTVFSATGGRTPYTFGVVTGSGTIDSNSGKYTAPASPGSATINVVDADGNASQAMVTINPALALSPSAITMTAASNYSYSFAAQGGVPPYAYSVVGPGNVNASSGLYKAGTASGAATLQVQDAQGSTASATVDSIWVRTNGPVHAATTDGSSWYLGGEFTSVNAYQAAKMIVLDATSGSPNLACNVADGFNGNVRALLQTGTTIYAAGDFTTYRGETANYLAKINALTCALDTVFSGVGTDGPVSALALNGSALYMVGEFMLYRGAPAQHLAKIDASSGALDTVFTQSTGLGSDTAALAAASNAVYVGGLFTSYRGQSAPFLAKLDPTSGALDTTFTQNPGIDGNVSALALDGQSLYVAGQILHYRGTTVANIIKIDAISGVLDTTFSQSSGVDNAPTALTVSASSLYAGGIFSNYRGTVVSNLIKLDKATSALDAGFSATAQLNDQVATLLVSGTSLYVGGDFTAYGGSAARYLAKVDSTTGVLDQNFTQAAGFDPTAFINLHHVDALSAQNSSLVVGGSFQTYRGTTANHLAKIDIATGAPDAVFDSGSGANVTVYSLLIEGASIFVGSGSSTYRNQPYGGLVKVDKTTGVPDTRFNTSPGFTGPVDTLALSGTSLYAGGGFASYDSTTAFFLAKLDSVNGTLDPAFVPQWAFGSVVQSVAMMGTRLFAGGEFYPSVAKLDVDTAAFDPAFAGINTDGYVYAVLTSGTSVYFAGNFQTYNGSPAKSLVKADAASGAMDTTFTQPTGFAGSASTVNTLVVSQNSLFAGGAFQTYRNAPAASIAKIDLVSGQLDRTFSQSTGPSGPIYAIAPVASAVWIGGDFISYRGAPAYFFVPLDPTTGALIE